jgi:hypothetical protein
MEFSEFIEGVKDFRRGAGQPYNFESLMWLIFLGTCCCGYSSPQTIAAFCQSESRFVQIWKIWIYNGYTNKTSYY